MSIQLHIPSVPTTKKRKFKLHLPAMEVACTTRWLVSGFPATVQMWSAKEWADLVDRPEHAQQAPNGTWVLLRID